MAREDSKARRSESDISVGPVQKLKPLTEGAPPPLKRIEQRVTELVSLTERGSLPRENEIPRAFVRTGKPIDAAANVQDVLHHSRFLIVRFIDKKRIISNPLGGGRGIFRANGRTSAEGLQERCQLGLKLNRFQASR